MTQLVTRVDERLVFLIDELVKQGIVESRSDAVRRGLKALIDETRRSRTAQAIIRGYQDHPQQEDEVGWADQSTIFMISEESW
ncbi:MAG: ribbon-helix-helix domain-containing protein [Acidimicrobiia bacterium]|nr:ribbon-helix-helix domain-containing protein [Acidimicrobiia bacterium]